MNGSSARMALIPAFALLVGVVIAFEADAHLAQWRADHAFEQERAETDRTESRYALVVRANGEPLADDDSMVGALKVAAGPLRFDIALYDECRIRSPRDDASGFDLPFEDRSTITVFVDPIEDEFRFDEPEKIDEPCLVEINDVKVDPIDPVWILKPVMVPPSRRAG